MNSINKIDILNFIAKHWWLTSKQLQCLTKKNKKNLYYQLNDLQKQGLIAKQAILNTNTHGFSLTKKGMGCVGLKWKPLTFRFFEYYHNEKIIKLLSYLFNKKNIKIKPDLYLTDRDVKARFGIAKSITIPDLIVDGIYYEIENSQSSLKVFNRYFLNIENQKDKDFIKEVQFWAGEPVYSYLTKYITQKCLLPNDISITFHNFDKIDKM